MCSLKWGSWPPPPRKVPPGLLDGCRARLEASGGAGSAGMGGLSWERGGWQRPHKSHGPKSCVLCISGKRLWASGQGDELREFLEVGKALRDDLMPHFIDCDYVFIFVTYGPPETHRAKAIFPRPFGGVAAELESETELLTQGQRHSQGQYHLRAL